MNLKEWMDLSGVTIADLATRLGCKPETVRRYTTGERIPDRIMMPRIAEETGMAVTANDFFGIAPSGQEAA
ncbi:MAG: helix-turn-helix transcriptional regulator [Sphingomonadales bacterium]|nr:helix-turn-helix transcriptional regulator [Sphingomonadales bacterium]MDE2171212.1 helix-turn-helix transcriptional regulator [Sphingomonadales bacterium]